MSFFDLTIKSLIFHFYFQDKGDCQLDCPQNGRRSTLWKYYFKNKKKATEKIQFFEILRKSW